MNNLQHSLEFNRQTGVGITEIMVSIAVGLFILAGVVQLYATSTSNAALVSGSSTVQENARYALSRIENDISQAGYAGCFSFANSVVNVADGIDRIENVIAGAEAAPGGVFDYSTFISATNDTDLNGIAFDTVTVRYASPRNRQRVTGFDQSQARIYIPDAGQYQQGDVAFISDCSVVAIFKVANANPGGDGFISFDTSGGYNSSTNLGKTFIARSDMNDTAAGVAPVFVYGGFRGAAEYAIATSAAGDAAGETCGSANPEYCALFRNGEEMVEGVQGFDVELGWQDFGTGNLFFKSADALVADDWALIDRVKLTATFNSVNRTPTNDGSEYISRTYTRTFVINNQLPGDNESQVAAGLGDDDSGGGDSDGGES